MHYNRPAEPKTSGWVMLLAFFVFLMFMYAFADYMDKHYTWDNAAEPPKQEETVICTDTLY